MPETESKLFRREGDPYIYLYLSEMGQWYCYDPSQAPLGDGAMGTVYKGFCCETKEVVAIKKVKDKFANNKMIRDRAKQEASLTYRHPNLIEMLGYCEEAPTYGPIFLVSKFVFGTELDKYVQTLMANVPNREEKICNLFYPILEALSYIHNRGVIHRDIKPSNIMVEQGNNVRLMDLGIAKLSDGNKFSAMGFIGTPEFAAPEQVLRNPDHPVTIDARSDIYSLGITLYNMLDGTNPMAAEQNYETLRRQVKDPLPASPRISKRLMQVIWKATEKAQSKRYVSAEEFKAAIQAALAPQPSLWERFMEWNSANPLVLIVALTLLFVFVCLIFMFG